MRDSKKYFAIVSRDLSQKIEIFSILYLRQELRDIKIVTGKGVVTTRGKVGEMTGQLTENFISCHQYLAVNIERIEKMTEDTIYFDTGDELSMGKTSYAKLRKKFNAYLAELTNPCDNTDLIRA